MEIVWVLDVSGTISAKQHGKTISFVKNVMSTFFPVSPSGNRAGIVKFGNLAHIQFFCNQHTSPIAFSKATDLVSGLPGQYTNTENGLKLGHQVLTSKGCGGRKVPQIMILITDGEANRGGNLYTLVEQAKRIQNAGIIFFAVAVGNFKLDQLHKMTKKSNVVVASDFDNLQYLKNRIVSKVCGSRTTTKLPSTTTTLPPTTTTLPPTTTTLPPTTTTLPPTTTTLPLTTTTLPPTTKAPISSPGMKCF